MIRALMILAVVLLSGPAIADQCSAARDFAHVAGVHWELMQQAAKWAKAAGGAAPSPSAADMQASQSRSNAANAAAAAACQ